ncbi:hypothetical protein ABC502_03025 [Alkalimonas sp. NCh-2]|uniref:hypothetical protein n=1 Tax=Alkalimonas sp. NCh-2 TaxID=3144846 RepID=UPI0031F611CB
MFGNNEYNTNSVVKAENDFLEAIRKHPQVNELTSSELGYLQMRQEYLHSQAVVAQYQYNALKYGSLITGFTVYESLSRAELVYGLGKDGLTVKNVSAVAVEAHSEILLKGSNKNPVIRAVNGFVSEVFNRMPWGKQSDDK